MLDWGIPPYLEQLQRTRRWLVGIQDQNRQQDKYLDDLYAFFNACWSLKDWIKKDESIPKEKRETIVRAAENGPTTDNIQICADVANLAKHLVRDPKRSPFKDATIAGAHVVLSVGAETTVAWNYFITHRDEVDPVAALAIAASAVDEWTQLFRDNDVRVD
ncbi:MAG: hypothetical protein EXS08_06575 [Planctomycetes bacterium]|nr:hypothetical protein [Planctomycetota bacterium]